MLKVVNFILMCFFIASSSVSAADSCSDEYQERMQVVSALMPEGGVGSTSSSSPMMKVFSYVLECINNGNCHISDMLIINNSVMVDENLVTLQRRKVQLVKVYFSDPKRSKTCGNLDNWDGFIVSINTINKLQNDRVYTLLEELKSQK